MGLNRVVVAGFVLVASAVAWGPATASAYRTLADDPELETEAPPRYDGTITWRLSARGLESRDRALLESAAIEAFRTWDAPSCSAIADAYGGSGAPAVAGDGISTIEVVTAGWSERGLSEERPAITDVQLRGTGGSWQIVEADIYLDFVHHAWDFHGKHELDVQGVLTHEIGHLLGLLHPCELSGGIAPMCRESADFMASSLYPTYLGTSQRALSSDDVAGVCALYPSRDCVDVCELDEQCSDGVCVRVSTTCDAGLCAPEEIVCSTDEACGHTRVCAVGGARAQRCISPRDRGAPCVVGDDCSSGLCLASERSGTYCTVTCNRDAECGAQEACAEVDMRRVCAPRAPASSCAVATGVSGTGLASRLTLAALMIAIAYRMRPRARTRENQ